MVLLPDCECCDCGDVCCQLAQRFAAATSLELDISGGTDYEATRLARVARTPPGGLACGTYPIGKEGIHFSIVKGSEMNGTFSLPLTRATTITAGIGGEEERSFEYVYPASQYTCSARIQVLVYLKAIKLVSASPLVFLRTLSSIIVQISATEFDGVNRDGTAIPAISGCRFASVCNPGNEQGGNYSYSGVARSFMFNSFTCGASFQLSGVTATSTRSFGGVAVTPSVFGLTFSDERGVECADWAEPKPPDQLMTLSFSNLEIVP